MLSCHWWLIPLRTYHCADMTPSTVREHPCSEVQSGVWYCDSLPKEPQTFCSCNCIDLNSSMYSDNGCVQQRAGAAAAAAGFIPFCSFARSLVPLLCWLHTIKTTKRLFFSTKSWLCLDVYDESVIISAGSYQHSFTLPFSFSQR